MRTAQFICVAVMLSGTVGCSTQLPTMNGVDPGSWSASGSSSRTHNDNNFGDWDNSGNAYQENTATIRVGNDSKINVKQSNLAVGNAAQQIGDANNISGGKGATKADGTSNDDNVGLWEDSGNTTQENTADLTAGNNSRAKLRQKNDASGATAQQIGTGNNVSSNGLSSSRSKYSSRRGKY